MKVAINPNTKQITIPKINFEQLLAYEVYESVFDLCKSFTSPAMPDSSRRKLRRQVESMVRESGWNGQRSGLISEAALETIILEKQGTKPTAQSRTATEHPIPPRVLADYLIDSDDMLSVDEFWEFWFTRYVFTTTTNEENQRLKKFQAEVTINDDWIEMYKKAGIKMVERPDFRKKAVREQYGV
jgi:hypothetical protein